MSRPTGRLDAEALARERQLLERSWKNTVATCLIATILKHRTPGMSLSRMPLFVWSMLVTSLMILFAMPT